MTDKLNNLVRPVVFIVIYFFYLLFKPEKKIIIK